MIFLSFADFFAKFYLCHRERRCLFGAWRGKEKKANAADGLIFIFFLIIVDFLDFLCYNYSVGAWPQGYLPCFLELRRVFFIEALAS